LPFSALSSGGCLVLFGSLPRSSGGFLADRMQTGKKYRVASGQIDFIVNLSF
jgi:hypothetical protein